MTGRGPFLPVLAPAALQAAYAFRQNGTLQWCQGAMAPAVARGACAVFLLSDPPPTQYDLRFVVLGIPVRIHPLFWLAALVTGMPDLNDRDFQLSMLLAWVAAFFVAILVHELGHALAMRSHGFRPWITLHGLGGMASYDASQGRPASVGGRLAISFAGPGAGFLLAALVVAGLTAAGMRPLVLWEFYVVPMVFFPQIIGSVPLTLFVIYLLHISVFWGFVNLLPVQPLDGGHIARDLLVYADPREGMRRSLVLSLATAVLVAVVALVRLRSPFITLLFAYLAYHSYAMLAMYRSRGPW